MGEERVNLKTAARMGRVTNEAKSWTKGPFLFKGKLRGSFPRTTQTAVKSIIRFDVNAIVDLSSLRSLLQTLHLQGGPSALGKIYVDIKFKVPSQA